MDSRRGAHPLVHSRIGVAADDRVRSSVHSSLQHRKAFLETEESFSWEDKRDRTILNASMGHGSLANSCPANDRQTLQFCCGAVFRRTQQDIGEPSLGSRALVSCWASSSSSTPWGSSATLWRWAASRRPLCPERPTIRRIRDVLCRFGICASRPAVEGIRSRFYPAVHVDVRWAGRFRDLAWFCRWKPPKSPGCKAV